VRRGKGEKCAAPELRLTRELLSPSRSTTGSRGKKHSRAVDKLEYLPVDVLRSTECRHGSIVFPQVNTVDTYWRKADQTVGENSRKRKQKTTRRKGWILYLRVFFFPRERKNTSVARLISLILASSARGLKNKFRARNVSRKCKSQFKDIF